MCEFELHFYQKVQKDGDIETILQGIRGLGGTLLKTNVDVKRARLIHPVHAGGC